MDWVKAIVPYFHLVNQDSPTALIELKKRLELLPTVQRQNYGRTLLFPNKAFTVHLSYQLVFSGFLYNIKIIIQQLIATYEGREMTRIAWSARCALECFVWVNYCKIDEEHLQRFHQNGLKEVKGFRSALEMFGHIANVGGKAADALVPDKEKLTEADSLFTNSWRLGIEPDDERPKPIYQAAIELNSDIEFRTFNTMFSKFTHTGPYNVCWSFDEEGHQNYCDMLMHLGSIYALASYDIFVRFMRAEMGLEYL